MKSDTRDLRFLAVLTVVLVCLAIPAVFTLPAYGSEIVGWGSQKTPNAPLTNLTKIAASGSSLAIKSDGSIVGWGWNYAGQCNVPSSNSGFVAIIWTCHQSKQKFISTLVGIKGGD
jgi:alpha-tubulin suppressor-like RCC1 family protein